MANLDNIGLIPLHNQFFRIIKHLKDYDPMILLCFRNSYHQTKNKSNLLSQIIMKDLPKEN